MLYRNTSNEGTASVSTDMLHNFISIILYKVHITLIQLQNKSFHSIIYLDNRAEEKINYFGWLFSSKIFLNIYWSLYAAVPKANGGASNKLFWRTQIF